MTFYTHKNKTQQGSPSKHAQPWNLWPKNILDVICRYLQIIYFSTFFPYVCPKPSSQDLSPRTKSSVRVAGLVVSASRNSESPSSNSSPGREPVPEVIFAGGIGETKKRVTTGRLALRSGVIFWLFCCCWGEWVGYMKLRVFWSGITDMTMYDPLIVWTSGGYMPFKHLLILQSIQVGCWCFSPSLVVKQHPEKKQIKNKEKTPLIKDILKHTTCHLKRQKIITWMGTPSPNRKIFLQQTFWFHSA